MQFAFSVDSRKMGVTGGATASRHFADRWLFSFHSAFPAGEAEEENTCLTLWSPYWQKLYYLRMCKMQSVFVRWS